MVEKALGQPPFRARLGPRKRRIERASIGQHRQGTLLVQIAQLRQERVKSEATLLFRRIHRQIGRLRKAKVLACGGVG